MLAALRSKLTYANVVSSLALFLVLSGGAAFAAHETIFSDDIVDGQVQNPDLGDDSVSSSKIQTHGVTTGDLAPNSVTATRIPDGAVGTSEIAQGSVFNADLAGNSITSSRVADDTLADLDIGADSVGSSELKDAAVGTEHIFNDGVLGEDVNSDTLVERHIRDETLTHRDIDDISLERTQLSDSTEDGNPATTVVDTPGNFTLRARCNRTPGGNLTGSLTIEHNAAGWAVDSTAPGGSSDQTSVPANQTRTLITVGPGTVQEIQAGAFSANGVIGPLGTGMDPIEGIVSMHIHRPVQSTAVPGCASLVRRFGGIGF